MRNRFKDFFAKQAEHVKDISENQDLKANYIHIKDAKFLTHAGCTPIQGNILWRGRLSKVSGFFLKEIETN